MDYDDESLFSDLSSIVYVFGVALKHRVQFQWLGYGSFSERSGNLRGVHAMLSTPRRRDTLTRP
jgi:hypothetical protein